MKSSLKHFGDVLITSIAYLAMIAAPILIVLVILRVIETGSGLVDLFLIIFLCVITLVARVISREGLLAHNKGERIFFR